MTHKGFIIFQRFYRNHYLKKISGPAYENICLSHNNKDIISLEMLWKNEGNCKVPCYEFNKILIFSYLDKNNFIRAFNILSLKNLLENNINIDPNTNKPFDNGIINLIKKKINFLDKIGYNYEIKEELTEKQKHYLFMVDVLKNLDIIGLFVDIKWFNDFSIVDLKKLYNELINIWNAFVEDNYEIANKIINDINNIFQISIVNFNELVCKQKMKNIILTEINKLVTNGDNDIIRKMGGYIVIGALAYISPDIRNIYSDFIFE